MTQIELLKIFSTFNKQDWQDFDNIKNQAFQPTPEEIAEQEAKRKANMIVTVQSLLAPYSISFTGDETDFTNLYTEYISWSPDMKEFFWEDLQSKINFYSTEKNNLNDFCNLILNYE